MSCLSSPALLRRRWRVVSWVDILLDVICGVESAMREGCPRTTTGVSQCWFSGHFRQVFFNAIALPRINNLTLSPTCGANQVSKQVFINAGALLLCTLDGVCVIVYVKFSSVGTVRFGGVVSFLHSGLNLGGVGPVRGLQGGGRTGWCEE